MLEFLIFCVQKFEAKIKRKFNENAFLAGSGWCFFIPLNFAPGLHCVCKKNNYNKIFFEKIFFI
jgi:hypothetical protein